MARGEQAVWRGTHGPCATKEQEPQVKATNSGPNRTGLKYAKYLERKRTLIHLAQHT